MKYLYLFIILAVALSACSPAPGGFSSDDCIINDAAWRWYEEGRSAAAGTACDAYDDDLPGEYPDLVEACYAFGYSDRWDEGDCS